MGLFSKINAIKRIFHFILIFRFENYSFKFLTEAYIVGLFQRIFLAQKPAVLQSFQSWFGLYLAIYLSFLSASSVFDKIIVPSSTKRDCFLIIYNSIIFLFLVP